MVRNSAPPVALFLCHFQRLSCFRLKKGPNGSTLESGTVFQNSSRVEPLWLHFFFSVSGMDIKVSLIFITIIVYVVTGETYFEILHVALYVVKI